jgi:hypothetical protein
MMDQSSSRGGVKNCNFLTSSTLVLGSIQPPIQWVSETIFRRVNWLGREANHVFRFLLPYRFLLPFLSFFLPFRFLLSFRFLLPFLRFLLPFLRFLLPFLVSYFLLSFQCCILCSIYILYVCFVYLMCMLSVFCM